MESSIILVVKGHCIETTYNIESTMGIDIYVSRVKAKRTITITKNATQLHNLVSCCFGILCIEIQLQIFRYVFILKKGYN